MMGMGRSKPRTAVIPGSRPNPIDQAGGKKPLFRSALANRSFLDGQKKKREDCGLCRNPRSNAAINFQKTMNDGGPRTRRGAWSAQGEFDDDQGAARKP